MSGRPAPGTSASEPSGSASARPRSRRPRTAARVGTARPDTSASGISAEELPDQQFFPEDDGFEEEEEEFSDVSEDDGVFAFDRPVTGAPPKVTGSDYGTSAPTTGVTDATSGTRMTGFSGAASSVPPLSAGSGPTGASSSRQSPAGEETGLVDSGGRLPELSYDFAHPPPFSGRSNPNNSSFAFSVSNRGKTSSTMGGTYTTGASQTSFDSHDTGVQPAGPRRVRSSAPLIPSTAGTDFSAHITATTDRGTSRGSYGMTELTGDATVPDGKTTWGDGHGGALKDISEQGEDVPIAEYDMGEEDSPYAEVRASVSNIDDPEMLSLTFRSWTLGMFFAVCGAALNTYFQFRTPSAFVNTLIVQMLAYPFGKFLARYMPIRTFRNPRWLGGSEWSFNPGPFNIKEHCIITMMANVAISPGYGIWAIVSSEMWYQRTFGVGFNLLFLISTQVTGFSMAGICRRFVVWPASMIWPSVLLTCTNLNTLHAEEEAHQGGMTRFKFLMLTGGGAFLWYWMPGYIFTGLSYFSWICWIAPQNKVINQVFGVSTGLGLSMLTFDWSQITWPGNPLVTPWWAIANVAVIFVLCYWIIVPILFYTNTWYTGYIPINTYESTDRFGKTYDVFAVLTPERTLNETAYAEYSPVYLSATYNMTYMVGFALTTALMTHTLLFHGPRIYRTIINVKTEADDIHAKLIKRYPGVPNWWYGALMIVAGGIIGVVAIEVWDTGLPVWAYFVALALAGVYVLPAAFIFAMTSQVVGINLVAQLIPGYMFDGKPIAGMLFKVVSIQTLQEALIFTQDMKFGHYMKVPPRHTYIAQTSAVLVSAFVQIAVKEILFATVPDICTPDQRLFLNCNNTKAFFTASVLWGLIGPRRLFSQGALYYPQVFCALIGAILPIPIWFAARRWPRSFVRNFSLPVGLNGVTYMPPANGVNYASFIITGAIFQLFLRRRRFAWWSKYNYVLAAALDVGTAMSALVIFLVLGLPGVNLNWWGTNVFANTMDFQYTAVNLETPATGFGPDTWRV